MPNLPHSRPLPDCLKPPNGIVMSPPSQLLTKTVALEHEKFKLLTEIAPLVDFFYKPVEFTPKAMDKVLKAPDSPERDQAIQAITEMFNANKLLGAYYWREVWHRQVPKDDNDHHHSRR